MHGKPRRWWWWWWWRWWWWWWSSFLFVLILGMFFCVCVRLFISYRKLVFLLLSCWSFIHGFWCFLLFLFSLIFNCAAGGSLMKWQLRVSIEQFHFFGMPFIRKLLHTKNAGHMGRKWALMIFNVHAGPTTNWCMKIIQVVNLVIFGWWAVENHPDNPRLNCCRWQRWTWIWDSWDTFDTTNSSDPLVTSHSYSYWKSPLSIGEA